MIQPTATSTPTGVAALPDFPWDSLQPATERAAAHPDGLVDLSVGTPVDPVPAIAQAALAGAANSPGYPLTSGTKEVRAAIADYLTRRWAAGGLVPEATMPVIGTKEFVAWLPTLLGLGPGDAVVVPTMAYPTYTVGALIAGCTPIPCDDLETLGDLRPSLVWLNSPSNPTGQILDSGELMRRVAWARDRGAVVASDECYGEFGWDAEPVSVLHPSVCGDVHDQLLAVHSLSKRSNLAGYRAGLIGGDRDLMTRLLAVRKHAGMIVPRPVQQAMITLLADDDHVAEQRDRYRARRDQLRPALERAGFSIEHSQGSLYLWATRDEPGRASIDFLAGHGILAAPGDFYGEAANNYVRIALTATDERIAAATTRLSQLR